MKVDFKPAIELIKKSNKVGIITHFNSDGDAIGSSLALRDVLNILGKKAIIFSNEDIKHEVKFLNLITEYNREEKYKDIDALIMLDTSIKKRLTCPTILEKVRKDDKKLIIIDHHKETSSDEMADASIKISEISSTSEILFWLFKEMKIKLTRNIIECLLVGIETDTSFLNNPSTKESTIRARKELIKLGGRGDFIVQNIKSHNPMFSNVEFLKEVNNRVVVNKDTNIVSCYIKIEDQKNFGIDSGISSIVANYLDAEYDSSFVLVAEQREKNKVKVSMRSNKSGLDVSKLASFFGGGGHKQAAGFEYKGKISDLLK